MSQKVRVILLEDIPQLGVAGDIVAVSEGYARNALFPAGRAALATQEAEVRATKKKETAKQQQEEELRQLQEQAEQIDGTELTISARLKENSDEIYGKITAVHIAKELQQQAHLQVQAKDITLDKPIKEVGNHQATITFGNGIEATIHLIIKPKE